MGSKLCTDIRFSQLSLVLCTLSTIVLTADCATQPLVFGILSYGKWSSGDRVAMQWALNTSRAELLDLGYDANLNMQSFLTEAELMSATLVLGQERNLSATIGHAFRAAAFP